jgi:tRNA nucleotidyltransferase (CCA-adding enzyme)
MGDLPVKHIMRAGRVTVQPSDSVESVQRLMIREGWGQIPVVREGNDDPSEPELIGIVTRTDLINILTNGLSSHDEPDMRELMINSLPKAVWALVQAVSIVAHQLDMPLYFVGGLVRDLLLEKPPKDIDMVVEGDAITLVKQLRRRYGGESRSHAQFGTAKWLLSKDCWQRIAPEIGVDNVPMEIDFVTARTEIYSQPSALPEVEHGSIKLDLHRRDFTINTIAVRLDGAHLGELLDFYGGSRDLQSGVIRVLHSLSFVDDPTRILRAVRLEQRLQFDIEERSSELIHEALPMLNRVTGERIRNELEMCLNETHRFEILERLAELGVLAQIHPGLTLLSQTATNFKDAEKILEDPAWGELLGEIPAAFAYFALMLLPLTPTIQHEVMARLKIRRSTMDDLSAAKNLLVELIGLPVDPMPSQVVKIMRFYPNRVIMVTQAAAGIESSIGVIIDHYMREWRFVRPSLNGNDLLALGLKAGPKIGELLDRLLAARLNGEVSDEDGERELISQWIADGPGVSDTLES